VLKKKKGCRSSGVAVFVALGKRYHAAADAVGITRSTQTRQNKQKKKKHARKHTRAQNAEEVEKRKVKCVNDTSDALNAGVSRNRHVPWPHSTRKA
jgi:ABC-type transport system involved in cytochrome bd biosynthesis fused ATPase/permease subunit